ncbi:MAG TPA: alpha/beta hydrolase [Propionibacteriaceae bacterium]
MSTVPIALLTPAYANTADWVPLATALGRHRQVLTPDLTPAQGRQVVLEDPALAVLATVSQSGADAAVLCGLGFGAMVAMTVATGFPDRVTRLVLSTTRTPESTALLSVQHGVRGLVPATTLQRLGGRPRQVIDLLDQVRSLDYRGWIGRVTVPALILVGELDVANLGPSRRLAAALPHAELKVVADAGPGWPQSQPERYAELVSAVG